MRILIELLVPQESKSPLTAIIIKTPELPLYHLTHKLWLSQTDTGQTTTVGICSSL